MTRKWLPAEWLDEMPPTTGDSPDAFLKRNARGVLQLTPIDDEWPSPVDIEPGAEVVFCWHEDRGTATLTVRADGSWVSDAVEADTNCFAIDGDLVGRTMEDVITHLKDTGGFDPGDVLVDCWTWSDGTPFEVRVLESGAASFHEVTRPADAGHPYGNEHSVS